MGRPDAAAIVIRARTRPHPRGPKFPWLAFFSPPSQICTYFPEPVSADGISKGGRPGPLSPIGFHRGPKSSSFHYFLIVGPILDHLLRIVADLYSLKAPRITYFFCRCIASRTIV